jgi:hypothetical protein
LKLQNNIAAISFNSFPNGDLRATHSHLLSPFAPAKAGKRLKGHRPWLAGKVDQPTAAVLGILCRPAGVCPAPKSDVPNVA